MKTTKEFKHLLLGEWWENFKSKLIEFNKFLEICGSAAASARDIRN